MHVDKHIGELLYDHDCVIVPNLGGFVANYTSAKINSTQHTFYPPSKTVVFNINLKNNDGLLANHIATIEGKSYTEALKYIDFFVKGVNDDLKKGAKVEIENVGKLYYDTERNIQFEPAETNFLVDAFGLSSFNSPAIKRDTVVKRIEKEFKDRDALPLEKKKSKVKRYVAAAVLAPVLFAMLWVPFRTDLLNKINYSSLNPFSSKEVKLPDAVPAVIPSGNTGTVAAGIMPTTSQPLTNIVEAVADTTKVETEVVRIDYKFHLVAGCFQVEENAQKFVLSLQSQNLNASIIGQNDKGMYVVSCGDFTTRKDATNELNNLRKVQPNAWLYRN
jgi:hypothetical protein